MLDLLIPALPPLMLLSLGGLLFTGLPVAVVLSGLGLWFGIIGIACDLMRPSDFLIPFLRIYGTLTDTDDLNYAIIPVLVFMGSLLNGAGFARETLEGFERLFHRVPGNIALAATLMAIVLAPMAGMIAAAVGLLGLVALPVMIRRGYPPSYAAGTLAAAGTLGIGLPPGLLLFFVAGTLYAQVPAVLVAMLGPSLLLVICHCLYHLLTGWRLRRTMPAGTAQDAPARNVSATRAVLGVLPGLAVIAAVLAPLILGWATISEASAVGALLALLLAMMTGRFSRAMFTAAIRETVFVTAMIFFIFMGSVIFSLTFRQLGGVSAAVQLVGAFDATALGSLGMIMLIVFGLGFILDWLEIVLVILPIFDPVIKAMDFGAHLGHAYLTRYWIAALLILNLQVSFITPPFGYALFLIRGVAPRGLRLGQIYRGVTPFILMHLLVIACVVLIPAIATYLPEHLFDLATSRGLRIRE